MITSHVVRLVCKTACRFYFGYLLEPRVIEICTPVFGEASTARIWALKLEIYDENLDREVG